MELKVECNQNWLHYMAGTALQVCDQSADLTAQPPCLGPLSVRLQR